MNIIFNESKSVNLKKEAIEKNRQLKNNKIRMKLIIELRLNIILI